jgi:hypothetical protein
LVHGDSHGDMVIRDGATILIGVGQDHGIRIGAGEVITITPAIIPDIVPDGITDGISVIRMVDERLTEIMVLQIVIVEEETL